MLELAGDFLTKFKARLKPKIEGENISKFASFLRTLKDGLESKAKDFGVEETAVDPVQALENFIKRLAQSKDSRIQRHGELIQDHLDRRLREFQEALKENPKLNLPDWVSQLTAMQVGDVVKGSGWNLEGLELVDYYKMPGQFRANWNTDQVWEILGEEKKEGSALEEKMWKRVPEKENEFAVGVQGDFGPGSKGRTLASYVERGIKVTKPGEKEAGINVLLQVEVPHKYYGIGYSHKGAILGLAFRIDRNTLETFLQNKIAAVQPVAGATR